MYKTKTKTFFELKYETYTAIYNILFTFIAIGL